MTQPNQPICQSCARANGVTTLPAALPDLVECPLCRCPVADRQISRVLMDTLLVVDGIVRRTRSQEGPDITGHMAIRMGFEAGVRAEVERRDKIEKAAVAHVCIVCKKPSGVHPSLCYEHDPDFGAKEVTSEPTV